MHRFLRAAVTVAVLTVAAASFAQVDLSPLFAAPTQQELDALTADWAGRLPTPTNFTVERTDVFAGYTVSAVSHEIEGFTHFGAVRYPLDFTPGGRFPVLVLLHGGFDGLTLDYLVNFDKDFPGGCLRDSFIVVAPTFRSEALNLDPIIGFRFSGGDPSPFDRDCDDTMALLTAVLLNTPEADPGYVVTLGGSRGGNVAYHLALRDPRIRRTAVRYGPTDFFLDHVRHGAQEKLDTGVTDDTLGEKVADSIAGPWLAGALTLAEARRELIRWSPALRLSGTEPFQIHHGEFDTTVPIAHSALVDSLMRAKGATPPDFVYYVYPLGGHTPSSLTGHEVLVEEYLCGLPTLTDVGSLPSVPRSLRGAPNPFTDATELSTRRDDKDAGAAPVVDITDMRGRLVRSLLLAARDGRWSNRWDGRDAAGRSVAVGLYFAVERGTPPSSSLKLLRLR